MEKEQLKIEYISLDEIKPNEYNPKKMTEKEEKDLEKSITEFGIVDPLIVNKAKGRKGIIIGGHQRYKIYKKLNFKKVPVVWIDVPDLKKEKELCLRLSKNTGSFDFDLLINFDEDLLKEVGFKSEELDEIFGFEVDDEFDTEKAFEKAIKNPRGVKDGDLWQLGDHRLYIGDATKKESWENVLGDERFDFMFTDPPYRIGYGIGTRKQKTKEGFKLQKFRTYPTIGVTNKEGKPIDLEKSPLGKMNKYFGAKKDRGYLGVDIKGGIPEYDEWLSIANEFQNTTGANVMIFENWKNTVDLLICGKQ